MSDGFSKVMDEVTDKSKVTWGPLAAIIGTVFIFFGAQIIGLILFLTTMSLAQSLPPATVLDTLINGDNSIYQFLSVVSVEAVTLGMLYLYLKFRNGSFKALGFTRIQWSDFARALAGVGIYFVAYIVVSIFVSNFVHSVDLEQEQEIGFDTAVSGISLVPIFISLVILPPLVEETLVRGFLFRGLRSKLPFVASTLITSALFAAAHLQWGGGAPLLWVAAIDTFVLSIVLCYLREKTGRLWAPIMVHGLKNFVAFSLLFLFNVV